MILPFLETPSGQVNHSCGAYTKMRSKNLNDAKRECQNNESCDMFIDIYGNGKEFGVCNDIESVSNCQCSSILHRRGNENAPLHFCLSRKYFNCL